MRIISAPEITKAVSELCVRAACYLPPDVKDAIYAARKKEESDTGQEILDLMIENLQLCEKEERPLCQDTGTTIIFLEKGSEVLFDGGLIYDTVNEGVRIGYQDGLLRKSIVRHPFIRENTKTNTPAVIHLEEVPGDKLTIRVMTKGSGCENMSRHAMLTPGVGPKGVIDFIVETAEKGWANPCPPIVIGIGIGGSFEYSALLSKKALFRTLGVPNPDPILDDMEKTILERVNNLGIGPQGLGGKVTALGVSILAFPTHIASLPVAVNVECHSHRHAEVTL